MSRQSWAKFVQRHPRHYGFIIDLGTSQQVGKRFELLCKYFDRTPGAWTIKRIKRNARTTAVVLVEDQMDATSYGVGFDAEPIKRIPKGWFYGHRLKLTGKDWIKLASHFKRQPVRRA